MNVSATAVSPRPGVDLAGGVARLVGSRGVASAQLAAASRLLKLGGDLQGPAAKLAQAAASAVDEQGAALASVAAGLGEMLDVYA